jgi:branched-chain amino acid transport system ATP-binding protein
MSAALKLSGVHKRFGKTAIINGVNLTVESGERHAIIGPNGAGKSTLFNLISGRFGVSAGQIKLKGEDVTNLEPFEINRRGLSRSFQVTNIFPKLSVYENIRCAVLWALGYKYSFWRRVSKLGEVRERAERILMDIGLAKRRETLAGVLSYAEQRALEIGITIAGGAEVILLDEPTSGMSHSETDQAVELVRKVSAGKTLVMVEHDMGVVFGLADRISVLVYGEIIATGVPAEIRANARVQEAYLGTAATTVPSPSTGEG